MSDTVPTQNRELCFASHCECERHVASAKRDAVPRTIMSNSETKVSEWEQCNARCEICPHFCEIPDGGTGFCLARKNIGGEILPAAYGKITSLALDPIEKKPLARFHPGAKILSVGSYGCNLRCPFCQNHEIAMPCGELPVRRVTPAELLKIARDTAPEGNIGIAFTYNEPLINYEFLRDTARLFAEAGLKNIVVTNGFINPAPLAKILPDLHAMNIDLKAFTQEFYKKIGGDVEAVKNTIAQAAKHCHIEVTTLLIPGKNDKDIEDIAKFLADIDPEIPLHISRFFPQSAYADRPPTPREDIFAAVAAARKHLRHVYAGNI